MKHLLLLAFVVINLPAAEMPPQPMEGIITWPSGMASLAGLPADLKQEIFRKVTQYGHALNVDALAKDILRLAGINKAWRATVNNLKNMLIILNALPRPAAISLVEKLGKLQLPVIQDNMLAILKTLPRSGAKYLAKLLARTPGMQNKEVQAWLNSFELEGGQELIEAVIALQNPQNLNNRNFDAIKKMIGNPNIKIDEKEVNGWTALKIASGRGYTEIVPALLAAGANVNEKDFGGKTALMGASNHGRKEIVRALLAAGANVNEKDINGNTALMEAATRGNTEVVADLIAAGADIHAKDNRKGFNALMLASVRNYPDIIRILLAAGADVHAKTNLGETALSLAQYSARNLPEHANDYAETMKLLEDAEKTSKKRKNLE